MPYQINIFNIKANGVNNNANIDFGQVIQNSHTANQKWVGTNMAFGDLSPTGAVSVNGFGDPDVSDQAQIANPAIPISNQF
ncbi:spore germination protein [Neobacillus sp. MM2021_6]|uniref:spore germination protein n=1 Tax=Bacillaceae TaxID=186817 RepID=UPI00140DF6D2|nr:MULTISPECIES: spore germination protein [Bacillaceae]MBO0958325.1 spore germination protein [Neobacillus sp. MM2021_6]NHC17925.1 spore germination protein [Bacillus sp. MM2020_4]WML40211.1 spore germination protein [Neobacillus sp. OS1-2]